MWKKLAVAGLCMASIAGFTACGSEDQSKPAPAAAVKTEAKTPSGDGKTLVVYFSATGNTEKLAQVIGNETKGMLYAITPEKPYTDADLNYMNKESRSSKEHDDPSIRPAVSGDVDHWDSYSTVYLGSPIWWGEAPNIVYTFVENHDFTGKKVIPFCTSASSGVGKSADHLKEAARTGDWMGGTRFSGGFNEKDVIDWVRRY